MADVVLPAQPGATRRAGKLPVELGTADDGQSVTPKRATVQVLDRKASNKLGVDGVLLAVRGTEGRKDAKVKLTLDHSAFSDAFGADWASRLSLVQLPECALKTPGKSGCTMATPVATPGTDDQPLSAEIRVDATLKPSAELVESVPTARSVTGLAASPGVALFAATAAPAGGGGDYKATPLSPSGQWAAGSHSGGFTWSYEIQTPDVPGGLEPELALGYNSQALDGRTAATNNQANWVGDGWSLTENFIERRYTPCNDDMTGGTNKAKNGDLCWRSDNATMSLNGQSHELVKDDATGTWKLKDDDGTRVERLKDTARGNGDADGEHWRITTTDGTRYHFGYNRLPGWSSGKPETASTWTVPVYGNQAGEPCAKSAFADSSCAQAWRWNLDYVVDTHDNASAYYYAAETNRYARNVSLTTGLGTPTSYVRGGHLARIEYGLRADDLYGAGAAGAKVEFTVAERCLPDASFDCAPSKMTAANAKRWPDVPVDQSCTSGDCKGKIAPTFWTTKRLTQITTSTQVEGVYQKVDTWKLRHQFPDPGDGSTPALWLAGITRTGHTGEQAEQLPEVTFLGQQLPNRVDSTGDGITPIVRYRVRQVNTETGSSIGVTYSAPDCKPGDLPSESANTRRCYPVFWSSADSPAADFKPVKDWFHKYVVTQVLENDLVGGSPTQQTDYTYLGGAAWAKSEDEFTKPEHRTYSDFRGYGEVRTQLGNGADGPKLDSRTRYFRGVEGAKVADFEGNELTDHPDLAGTERAEAVYNGSQVISEETTEPWRKGPVATRVRPGLPALTSYLSGVEAQTTRSPAKDGSWQRTKTERTFDGYGMPVTETEHGDTGKTGDESCAVTAYARNTAANILELVASERTTAGTCGAKGALLSDKRTYYDGSGSVGAAPSRGDATREDENDGAGTGFVTAARTTFDRYGRPVEITDAENRSMTTAFTPATGLPTKVVTTNALGHTLTTEIDPRRGTPLAEIDANGKRTDLTHDGLGRLTAVWEPGRDKSKYPQAPSAAYEYRISRTAAPVVTTRELRGDGSTETSYAIYDGLLRERQTQSPAAAGDGRVLTENRYDSRGLEWKSFDDYYATGEPAPVLVAGDDTKAPAVLRTEFDAAGRPTAAIAMKFGEETRRTTSRYEGNHTTVVPPEGGTARTTVTDALGRPSEIIEYTNAARTTSQSLKYSYNVRGLLERVTDPAGNERTYSYDARGRQTESVDPDQGATRIGYDVMDRPVTTTDARGVTLRTSYDALGRRTEVKEGDHVRSQWSYDSVAKGEMSESRRFVGGQVYAQKISGYTNDYQATGLEVTIPAAEGALAGTYKWGFAYNAWTGMLTQMAQPAMGDLPAERVVTRYDSGDQAQGLTANGRILVNSSTYDPFGRVQRTEYNDKARRLYRSWSYDEHTGELLRTTTDRTLAPQRVDDTRYSFDRAGNVDRIVTETGQDETKQKDTQCFVTDALQRLTQAWTSTDGCEASPTKSNVGGPGPYWLSYSFDALGNRTKEIRHDTSGDTAKDVVRTYHYAKSGGSGPTALTSVTTHQGGTASVTDTFDYDASGNTVSRKSGGRDQTLSWDSENQLASVTEFGAAASSYTYDGDGGRLLRKDGQGTTLYLPGGNELLLRADGKTAGTRYYEFEGDTVAARTGGQLQFLFADHHGTANTAIDATTQVVMHRSLDPFGNERSAVAGAATALSWPGGQGFVNGTKDATGLTQLGARAYDPALGRFLSVDPMVDQGDSQRMNAYSYANNNPVTFSDPDGLFFGKLKNAFKKVTKKVTQTVKKVTKVVKKAVATVKSVVKKVTKTVKRVTKTVARAAKKVIKKTVRVVKKYAKKAYKTVKRVAKKAGGYVKKQAGRAWSGAKSAAKSVARGVSRGAWAVGGAIAKGWNAATTTGMADVLGKVSTITGAAAGVLALTGVGAPLAAALGAVSLGTGVASAGIYAYREGFGSQNFKNAAVGAGLGIVGGGLGRLAGRAAAGLSIRGARFIEGGLKAGLPHNAKGVPVSVGIYGSLKYDAMPATVGAATTDWSNWSLGNR
ncbi:RHS repeat domain-containing protein [Streptomyces sp. NPDC006879]|uniref:RHS repeat domain-containing protein n=1 Tax=Streptomyces sp. NPDC006879 TaxID=3364767 RepID=UPI0036825A12